MPADHPHHSTASATGSPRMLVRANVPCVVNVGSSCRYIGVWLADNLVAFREKMADHPPRTPAAAATPRTPATAAT